MPLNLKEKKSNRVKKILKTLATSHETIDFKPEESACSSDKSSTLPLVNCSVTFKYKLRISLAANKNTIQLAIYGKILYC